MKQVESTLKIGVGFQRLVFFFLFFLIFIHIVSCVWVLVAQLQDQENFEGTWMDGDAGGVKFHNMSSSLQYLTSSYYTVTTITTVGYGDIAGVTTVEKVFCIFIMLIGVIAFSFFSGSLASIIQNYDISNAKFQDKLESLNRIQKNYLLPLDLYMKLK